MLKGIDPALTPDLLWALAAMGHGDVIAIVDANYPAYALHDRVIPLAGVDLHEAMAAIGALLPIDQFVEPAVHAMTPDGEPDAQIEVHQDVAAVLAGAEGRAVPVAPLERADFYRRAKSAFAVVLTGERRSYACFLVTKGVVVP